MRPAYLSARPAPQRVEPMYQHLVPRAQMKPSLYGYNNRKFSPFRRFQIGTTTTFNGYTNVETHNTRPPMPPPRQHRHTTPSRSYPAPPRPPARLPPTPSPYYRVSSVFEPNTYQHPHRRDTRTYTHAQQFHPQQHQHRPPSRNRFQLLSRLPSRSPSPSYHRLTSPYRRHRQMPPPIKPRRQQQQQQQQQQYYNNNGNSNKVYNNVKPKVLILSDSMLSRVRTYALRRFNSADVDLSYQSGCDGIQMINWMQSQVGQETMSHFNHVILSLGTNDIDRYGVETAIKNCSQVINYLRSMHPNVRTIAWMALSPRWKPTRFISGGEIGQLHMQFNERLHSLAKQMNIEIINARLGIVDMREEDGLHPSMTTGRWKYEEAIRKWIAHKSNTDTPRFFNNIFQQQQRQMHNDQPSPQRTSRFHPDQQHYYNNITLPSYTEYTVDNNRRISSPSYRFGRQRLYSHRVSSYHSSRQVHNPERSVGLNNLNSNLNSTQPFIVTEERTEIIKNSNNIRVDFPSRNLIKFYPHKLRTVDQFFRENEPPKELEKEKDKIYMAANMYFQMKHFEEESKKWKIYERAANRNTENRDKEKERETNDVEMREEEEVPTARPFKERHSGILNMTISEYETTDNSSSESSKESGSEEAEEERKKRKLRDTSLSPTSKNKEIETSIRKRKEKSKKKKKLPIEDDPRAPLGSPTLLTVENREREKEKEPIQATTVRRPDTPNGVTEKKTKLFSHEFRPPRMQKERRIIERVVEKEKTPEPPSTPTGPPPPPVSPRQSTPKTPVAAPQPLITVEHEQETEQIEMIEIIENIETVPMEQEARTEMPSTTSKDAFLEQIETFEFPIIAIECKYHFKTFNLRADPENISDHREFLERKTKQQNNYLEKVMQQIDKKLHRTVVEFIKNSIEPIIESLKISNRRRIENMILDHIKEKAIRTIRLKSNQQDIEHIERAEDKFERVQQLKFQLAKLDRRLNENMPPPALNVLDKLQFRSKELSNEAKEQYNEQWNTVIRKTKLEFTSIMRIAKVAEIEKSEKEHRELAEKIPTEIRSAYRDLIHTIEIRHSQKNQKKLDFLEKKAIRIIEK
jgi:hypothetical protein